MCKNKLKMQYKNINHLLLLRAEIRVVLLLLCPRMRIGGCVTGPGRSLPNAGGNERKRRRRQQDEGLSDEGDKVGERLAPGSKRFLGFESV